MTLDLVPVVAKEMDTKRKTNIYNKRLSFLTRYCPVRVQKFTEVSYFSNWQNSYVEFLSLTLSLHCDLIRLGCSLDCCNVFVVSRVYTRLFHVQPSRLACVTYKSCSCHVMSCQNDEVSRSRDVYTIFRTRPNHLQISFSSRTVLRMQSFLCHVQAIMLPSRP